MLILTGNTHLKRSLLEIFPHVGRNTLIRSGLQLAPVLWPCHVIAPSSFRIWTEIAFSNSQDFLVIKWQSILESSLQTVNQVNRFPLLQNKKAMIVFRFPCIEASQERMLLATRAVLNPVSHTGQFIFSASTVSLGNAGWANSCSLLSVKDVEVACLNLFFKLQDMFSPIPSRKQI